MDISQVLPDQHFWSALQDVAVFHSYICMLSSWISALVHKSWRKEKNKFLYFVRMLIQLLI